MLEVAGARLPLYPERGVFGRDTRMMGAEMANPKKLIRTIQRFEAVNCIGPSTLRGQGRGVIKATRNYLAELRLGRIPKHDKRKLQAWLDRHTEGLLDSLPISNRPWGAARKALNLFLRSAVYNHYLRKAFRLRSIVAWLEIPVDSVIGKALKREAPGGDDLPRWPGLKHLKPEEHKLFQQCARRLARERGLPARVFLDNFLFLKNR
jgi:hypothetical protein